MARPAIVKGSYLTILVGDSSTPTEVFAVLCGLRTRTFTTQVNTSDIFVADCADPEDIPTRQVNTTGKQWDMSGEGVYNRTQAGLVRNTVGVSKNYRFSVLEPVAPAVQIDKGYYSGKFVLTNHQIGGADGTYATGSFTFVSDGPVVWVPAP